MSHWCKTGQVGEEWKRRHELDQYPLFTTEQGGEDVMNEEEEVGGGLMQWQGGEGGREGRENAVEGMVIEYHAIPPLLSSIYPPGWSGPAIEELEIVVSEEEEPEELVIGNQQQREHGIRKRIRSPPSSPVRESAIEPPTNKPRLGSSGSAKKKIVMGRTLFPASFNSGFSSSSFSSSSNESSSNESSFTCLIPSKTLLEVF